MSAARRWPLHPAPKEGEALSSWLSRVAVCYHMTLSELLEYEFGYRDLDELDISPPMPLLQTLHQRSGVDLDQLRCMSFSGWVPWLLDSCDAQIPDAFDTYVSQLSVLLPNHCRKPKNLTYWRAWITPAFMHRACPLCINDLPHQPRLLVWKIPLMLSCPVHGCWLEPCSEPSWPNLIWENPTLEPRMASADISLMDRRTWQALTTGFVELPRRRIHAGLWFRLLRTLLDELNTPLSNCGGYAVFVRMVWERCGYPFRAGKFFWRAYEQLDLESALKMLEAAATAIKLIESKYINPIGEHVELFQTIPHTEFTNGLTRKQPRAGEVNYWGNITELMHEVMAEAKCNQDAARTLFNVASYGQRDPESLEKLRHIFADAGIPMEFVSHYVPTATFACHRINDELGDIF